MNHHAILAKASNVVAYVYPDGIMYRFKSISRIGTARSETSLIGFVKKRTQISHHGDVSKTPYPYLMDDISPKTVESLRSIAHYASEGFQEMTDKGITRETIYAETKDGTTLVGNKLKGLFEHDLELGCRIRDLKWPTQTMKAELESHGPHHDPIAFVIEEKLNQ